MAGDWIPYTVHLTSKLEVLQIAAATNRTRREVVAILLDFWAWVDAQTEDGLLPGISVATLSAFIADTNETFWRAVVDAGWLTMTTAGLAVPHFDYWMGRSAKRRLKDSRNKRENRKRNRGDVRSLSASVSASHADKTRTTVQDSTEQNKTPSTPPPVEFPEPLRGEAFAAAWDRWIAYRREAKKPAWKPVTVKSQLAQLATWGEAQAIASIEASIRNGWSGLFEPKEKSDGRSQAGREQPVGQPGRVHAPPGKYDHLGAPPAGQGQA